MIFPRNYNISVPIFPVAVDYFQAPYSEVTQMEGTSLSIGQQWRLQDVIQDEKFDREEMRVERLNREDRKPLGKKLGVYVDGKLRLQTRDSDAAYAYAEKRMAEKHDVWVAPVGSFVTV